MDPCQLCGSTSFVKDQNGFFICSNGHQVEGYWEEQDDFDPIYGGLRRMRPSQNVGRSTQTSLFGQTQSSLPPLEYEDTVTLGDSEGFAVFKVFQKILRAQVSAIKMHCCFMPENYEDTVRSLWCKYVTAVGLDYSEEQVIRDTTDQSQLNINSKEYLERFPNRHLEHVKTDNPYSKIPRLPLTLALLYLACVYCKVPILLSEIRQWAVRGIIPYALTLNVLSEEERRSLSRADQRRFERSQVPSMSDLFSVAARVGGFLARRQHCPLAFQEPIIIVWKQLDRLGLPLDLYPVVMKLLKKIGVGIEYRVCRLKGRYNVNAEISVMAAVIFIVKLFYNLAGNVETPHEPYYKKLVEQHGLPDYQHLTNWWRRKLASLRHDFILNDHSVLYWEDLNRYSAECKTNLPRDRSRLVQAYFEEFPDLMRAIESLPSRLKAPSQRTDPILNPFASCEVDFVRVVSRRMANNCLVYPRNAPLKRFHNQFKWILELAALSMNVEVKELYREYHRLFQLYPPGQQ